MVVDERYMIEYNDKGECTGILDTKNSILYITEELLVDLLNEKEAEINRLERSIMMMCKGR
jgi:hypothetical protein